MKQYQDLIRLLIDKFDRTQTIGGDRTGVGTVKIVGHQMRFDLSTGEFPMVTIKKSVWKAMVAELLWFLKGSTDNNLLNEMGAKFWNPWAVTEKDLVDYYLKKSGKNAIHGAHDHEILDWLIADGYAPKDCRKHLGQLGPIYSKSWVDWEDVRAFEKDVVEELPAEWNLVAQSHLDGSVIMRRSINQIQNAVDLLKNNPNSRRIIVNAWDPRHIPEDFWPDGSKKTPQENVIEGRASLAFCHAFFQFVTEELTREDRVRLIKDRLRQKLKEGEHLDENDEYWEKVMNTEVSIPTHRLNCLVTIRSSDTALGLPVNIASYALLLHMFALVTNMTPGELIINTGDSHLYANQIEPMRAILEREPLPLPTLRLNPEVKDIFQFKMEDISLDGYEYHPEIRMDVAV